MIYNESRGRSARRRVIEGDLNELSFAGKTLEWRLPAATAANSAGGKTSKRERNCHGREREGRPVDGGTKRRVIFNSH